MNAKQELEQLRIEFLMLETEMERDAFNKKIGATLKGKTKVELEECYVALEESIIESIDRMEKLTMYDGMQAACEV